MGFTRELASDYSDCYSLHAEANALSVCERIVREGGTIYVTSAICFGCAKLVANSGLTRAVIAVDEIESFPHRNAIQSYEFLRLCGMKVDFK
jgi:deoxycytidylate deaminase